MTLITYERMCEKYCEWCIKNGLIEQDAIVNLKDDINKLLENRESEGNATHFYIEKRTKDGRYISFRVIEYTEPIYDDDGDVDDYKILGYVVE